MIFSQALSAAEGFEITKDVFELPTREIFLNVETHGRLKLNLLPIKSKRRQNVTGE
jgi:hypothetical protein